MKDYIVRATAANSQFERLPLQQENGRICQSSAQYQPCGNGCTGTSFNSRFYDGNYDER